VQVAEENNRWNYFEKIIQMSMKRERRPKHSKIGGMDGYVFL
jgi:hypothetical protein